MDNSEVKLAANRAHDLHNTTFKSHSEHANQLESMMLRAPSIASAAGIVAILGFYSANYATLSKGAENLENFNEVLFWLSLSFFISAICPFTAFFSNNSYAYSASHVKMDYVYPYVHETSKSKSFWRLGDFFRSFTLLLLVFSMYCLFRGGKHFLLVVGYNY